MPYTPHTESDWREMLDALGLERVEELFACIPADRRLDGPLPLPEGLGEAQVQRRFAALAARNRPAAARVSFLGGGVYDHAVPAAVSHIASRPEFATAYTPYQAEVSQGTLQVIFEFQTHIARLTGLPVANASLYDGASALAEAALIAARTQRRNAVLVPASLNPRYAAVVRRYCRGQDIEVREVPARDDGEIDAEALRAALGDDVAGVVVQTPNAFGVIERPWTFADAVREAGALLVACVDPVSLSVLRPPGEWGADVAVGDGQPLGIPMSFGGPLLGFIAAREKLVRRMPGRIVSATRDVDGRPAYVLTLQTREQHIRREKATSNICTNQGLMATRATVYLSLLGERGFTELGRACFHAAHRLAERIESLEGYSVRFAAPFFREFVVRCPVDAGAVAAHAREHDVLAGIPLRGWFGESFARDLLVAVTEKHTDADFDALCRVLESVPATASAGGA